MSKIINPDGDELCQEPIPVPEPIPPVIPPDDDEPGPGPTPIPPSPVLPVPPGGGGGNICDLPWFRDSLFCAGGGGRTPRDRDSFPCTGFSDNSNCFTMFTVEGWTCNSDGTIRENRSSTTSNCVATYSGFPQCGCSQDGIFMGCCYLKTWAWPAYPCCPTGGGPFYLQVNDRDIARETIRQNVGSGNYSVFRDDSGTCYYTSYLYDPISIPLDSNPNFVTGSWIDDCDSCKNYKFNKICTEEECGGADSIIIDRDDWSGSDPEAFDKIKVTFDDNIISCYEYSNYTCDDSTDGVSSWSDFNGLVCSDCCQKYKLTPCTAGLCSGGSIIYTDNDLSASDGAAVKLDDDICYSVESGSFPGQTIEDVTVNTTHNNCTDCCPAASAVPCTDCGEIVGVPIAQGGIGISISGSPTGHCDLNGLTYSFLDFATGTPCRWRWSAAGGAYYNASLWYHSGTGIWSAQLTSVGGFLVYENTNITGVSCNDSTGQLVGSFTLAGVNFIQDCTSHTATWSF